MNFGTWKCSHHAVIMYVPMEMLYEHLSYYSFSQRVLKEHWPLGLDRISIYLQSTRALVSNASHRHEFTCHYPVYKVFEFDDHSRQIYLSAPNAVV